MERGSGDEVESLLVWTTTPWTLAANVAAAVHPDLIYEKVRQGADVFYVSKGARGTAVPLGSASNVPPTWAGRTPTSARSAR